MRTKQIIVIGVIVAVSAFGLTALVAQSGLNGGQIAWKKQPPLLNLKSGGEVIGQLQLLKPSKLKVTGGMELSPTGNFRSPNGTIEITVEGATPWRISGSDLEVELTEKKPETK